MEKLLEGLTRNPWGRTYKMVLGKLLPWAPPLTGIMDPKLLGRVVNTLFLSVQETSGQPEISQSSSIWPEQ